MPKAKKQAKSGNDFLNKLIAKVNEWPWEKYWRWFVIGLATLGIIYFLRQTMFPARQIELTPQPSAVDSTQFLPEGWSEVSPEAQGVVFRAEKNVEEGVVPTAVLIKSQTNATNIREYVDALVEGTRRVLPGMNFVQNDEGERDGFYVRTLMGSYMRGSERIGVTQQIYVSEGKVYTLTASYSSSLTDNNEFRSEINRIFEALYERYVRTKS